MVSKNKNYWMYLVLIFLVVQVIGLVSANYYFKQDLNLGIINNNPNDVWNAVALVGEIIFMTALILIFKKLFKSKGYLKLFEYFALFVGMVVVLEIFLPYVSALFISFLLLWIRDILKRHKSFGKILLWYNNLLLALSIAGAGSLIGLSLGLLPVTFFLILLSIYDFVAVFYTKHMVTLANMFKKQKLSLMFSIPTKKKNYFLGGGDLVVPLVVSSSLFIVLITKYSFITTMIAVILIWITSLIGLAWTFWFLENNRMNIKALPALPPQAILILMVIFWVYVFLV